MNASTKSEKRNQRRRPRKTRRHGLTLIEILIALTMTLIVLFAMMQAFQYASSEIAKGRASLEMSNQLRSTMDILQTDLDGVTVDVRPHTEQVNPAGYFEYVEGPRRDYGLNRQNEVEGFGGNNFVGDYDDIIAFTTKNTDRLFRGRFFDIVTGLSGLIESSTAEVVWWTWHNNRDNDTDVALGEKVTLYRRSLLIRPDLNINDLDLNGDLVRGLFLESDEATVQGWMARNDISVRWVDLDEDGDRDTVVANSLFDLARRENRYCHEFNLVESGGQPGFHNLLRVDNDNTILSLLGTRMDTQDDIMLADILAFDVKIYSRNARVDEQSNLLLDPNDIGYDATSATAAVIGSFVDLGYGTDEGANIAFDDQEHFLSGPDTNSEQLSLRYLNPVEGFDIAYCTWSPHYESDGIDQDDDGVTDQGTDGQDNDGDDVPDDRDEMEVVPPYPYPARGIKITFRLIEKGSRQVRQQSMTHSFIPE